MEAHIYGGGGLGIEGESRSVADPAGELSDDELTEKATSALSGGPWIWLHADTLRCLENTSDWHVSMESYNYSNTQKWTNTPSTYGDKIVNVATGQCLAGSAAGDVYTWLCTGGANQQWVVTELGGSAYTVYEVRNAAHGLCLDGDASGNVYAVACNGGSSQRWR
jgi:Ricin-type beta-trefoil lectin domain-like